MRAERQRPATKSILLHDEAHTRCVATTMAAILEAPEMILLSGPLGAGKSSFARALIGARAGVPVEAPSPTFSLVQTYDLASGAIWHFDLYRLAQPAEVYELGWEDALGEGIAIVEWPERLGTLRPIEATLMSFGFTANPAERTLQVSGRRAERLRRGLGA